MRASGVTESASRPSAGDYNRGVHWVPILSIGERIAAGGAREGSRNTMMRADPDGPTRTIRVSRSLSPSSSFVFSRFNRLELLLRRQVLSTCRTRANGEWIGCRRMAGGTTAAFYATRTRPAIQPPVHVAQAPRRPGVHSSISTAVRSVGRRVWRGERADLYAGASRARPRQTVSSSPSQRQRRRWLIVSVDLTQEFRKYVVTDRGWQNRLEWRPDILERDRAPFTLPHSSAARRRGAEPISHAATGIPFAPRKRTPWPKRKAFSLHDRTADIRSRTEFP